MKLKKAYLKAFGKFIDTSIAFCPNINLIYGDNEAGKSTLGEFLFHMLYGQKKYGVKKRIYIPNHMQYFPWNHSIYQGVLQYSLREGIYRIERNFHNDFEEVKIFDEKTGQEITNEFPLDVRKELQFLKKQIGLNERDFKNTVYVAQNEMKGLLYGNKDRILEELLGKALYGIDSEHGEKTIGVIMKELEKRKKDIGTKNNKNKPLGNNYRKLREKLKMKYELEKKMHSYNENQQALSNSTQKLKKLQKEIERLKAEIRFLEIKNLENKINDIENLLKEKEDLVYYIEENFSNSIKESSIDELYRQRIEVYKQGRRFLPFILVTVVAIILLIIWLGISKKLWLQLPLLVTSIALSISRALKWKDYIKKEEKLFYQLEKANQYQDALNELQRLQDKINHQESFCSLKQWKEKLKCLKEKEILPISTVHMDKDILTEKLRGLKEKEQEIIREKILLEIRAQEKNWDPKELEETQRDISNLQEIVENLEEDIQAIDLAIATFKELEQEKKSKWLPQIIKKTEKNIYKITKKYNTIKIDDKYEIKTLDPKSGKLISIEQLSQGTFNQFYFAIRLGLIQALSPRPIHLPIILDEPFVQFDDQRFEESMNLLQEISKTHQIIIFTSQGREREYLDQKNIVYHYIEL